MAVKTRRLFALLLVFVLLAGCSGKEDEQSDAGEPVVWVDAAMEWAVRAELKKPEGEILTGELQSLQIVVIRDTLVQFNNGTVHYLEGDPVARLDDIVHFERLGKLHLSQSSIADLSPVEKMQSLQQVSLYNCDQLEDIAALESLGQLVVLQIVNCPVQDYSPVMGLSKLIELEIDGGGLETFNIGGLTALRRLRLPNNRIDDLSFLAGGKDYIELDLNGNQLESLERLPEAFLTLQILRVGGNKIRSIDVVEGMERLVELDISGNELESVEAIRGLETLETLRLADVGLASADAVTGLVNLKSLDLSGNGIPSVKPLEALTKLRELDLSGSRIADVTLLQTLEALRKLNLVDCGISETELAALKSALDRCEIRS